MCFTLMNRKMEISKVVWADSREDRAVLHSSGLFQDDYTMWQSHVGSGFVLIRIIHLHSRWRKYVWSLTQTAKRQLRAEPGSFGAVFWAIKPLASTLSQLNNLGLEAIACLASCLGDSGSLTGLLIKGLLGTLAVSRALNSSMVLRNRSQTTVLLVAPAHPEPATKDFIQSELPLPTGSYYVSRLTFHRGKKITDFEEEKPCFRHFKVCFSRGTSTFFPLWYTRQVVPKGVATIISVGMYTWISEDRCLPQWSQMAKIMTGNVRMNSR